MGKPDYTGFTSIAQYVDAMYKTICPIATEGVS